MINRYIIEAYSVLSGESLDRNLAFKLSQLDGTDLMDLYSLANKVKNKFSPEVHICSIANVKSGKCGEDCKYCAQSAHYNTNIVDFPLISESEILQLAEQAISNKVNHFGLVSSGKGFKGNTKELNRALNLVNTVKEKYPQLNVCLALGILDREAAKIVADTGIYHYNHNLQVNPDVYETYVSKTHQIEERVNTIKYLKEYGVKVCSGGIFGLGESAEDRVELAFALKDLDVSVIPINILVPIEGTPIYNNKRLAIKEALKATAIFRLIHPEKTIKLAAGRETVLKDFQALFMNAGVNGFLTGGYLTTRGRSVAEDKAMLHELK